MDNKYLEVCKEIIDEFADLMFMSKKVIESCILNLAQKSSAVGIYLVIATQSSSAYVLTGKIKSNFPTRICFRTSTYEASKAVLGQFGAHNLLGYGDFNTLHLLTNIRFVFRARLYRTKKFNKR